MTVVLPVAEVLEAVRPVAAAMLRPDEFRQARSWITEYGEWDDEWPGEVVVEESMTVAWKVVGNRGSTGSLVLRGDQREMLHAIAGQ